MKRMIQTLILTILIAFGAAAARAETPCWSNVVLVIQTTTNGLCIFGTSGMTLTVVTNDANSTTFVPTDLNTCDQVSASSWHGSVWGYTNILTGDFTPCDTLTFDQGYNNGQSPVPFGYFAGDCGQHYSVTLYTSAYMGYCIYSLGIQCQNQPCLTATRIQVRGTQCGS